LYSYLLPVVFQPETYLTFILNAKIVIYLRDQQKQRLILLLIEPNHGTNAYTQTW